MYGLLIEAIVETIKNKYGEKVWFETKKRAKIDQEFFNTHQQYSEALLQKILKGLSLVTGENANELMEMFGVEFIVFMCKFGYGRVLRILGRSLRDFLNGLDNLHEYMRYSYPKLKPPSFFVEKETPNGLTLHYRTKRRGFSHYVKGQIREIGRMFYKIDVEIEIISEKIETDLMHVTYQLHFQNKQYLKIQSSALSTSSGFSSEKTKRICKPIKSGVFFDLFPFYVLFNRNLEITSIGDSLKECINSPLGENIIDVFNLVRPYIPFTWNDISSHTNNVFELSTIEPVMRENDTDRNAVKHDNLKLRGQMIFVKELDCLVYLATPIIENVELLYHTGLYINDLSMHDASRDLIILGTQHSNDLKAALSEEKEKSKALEVNMKKLDDEVKRADELLYRMIPKNVADRLRNGESTISLCEVFSSVTILFSDVIGFTSTCTKLSPMEVVSLLNEMYTKFDKALENHKVYKVETIGDAYMIVSGAPDRTPNHAVEILEMAFDMLEQISTLRDPILGTPMKIRIGCHTGSVVSGVVGLRMPRYCLFGETVNTANRMEATSEAMRIHITQTTKQFLPENAYKIVERGILETSENNCFQTYLVIGKYNSKGMLEDIPCLNVDETDVNSEKKFNPKWQGFKLMNK